jgi:hypothetical protein
LQRDGVGPDGQPGRPYSTFADKADPTMSVPTTASPTTCTRRLVRTQRWLIEQGRMRQDGTDVLFRDDLLKALEQRELQQRLRSNRDALRSEIHPNLLIQLG